MGTGLINTVLSMLGASMNDKLAPFDVAVIGGGPAGYAAAIYAARASLNVIVVEQGMPGGQIATTDIIENYPGIESISGFEFGQKLQDHAAQFGVLNAYSVVSSIERTPDATFVVHGDPDSYHAKAVIVATGASPRHVGFEGEDRFTGRGISYCATCDGMFYRGKEVFVIGGGTAACEEAMYLSKIATKVTMVVRRDEFRAPKGVVDRMLACENVQVRYETSITHVDGDAAITTIQFKNNRTGEVYEESFDEGLVGIFVFAGTNPATKLVEDFVDLGADGGVVTDEDMATRTPGIFCAGDMRSKHLRQVITAAADGAIAGMSAYRYLSSH